MENYLTTKEALKVIKNNTKRWFKEHKEIILAGTLTIAGAVFVGCVAQACENASKKNREHEEEGKEILDVLNSSGFHTKNNQLVDEIIFTDIAPQIEDLVLADGVDEGVIDTTFVVDYPLNGDFGKGVYNGKKNVHVVVRDAWEPESEES